MPGYPHSGYAGPRIKADQVSWLASSKAVPIEIRNWDQRLFEEELMSEGNYCYIKQKFIFQNLVGANQFEI